MSKIASLIVGATSRGHVPPVIKEELCLRLRRAAVCGAGGVGVGSGGARAVVLTALSDDRAWDHESLRLLIERVAPVSLASAEDLSAAYRWQSRREKRQP
jgi:hypothetical protein